MKAEKHMLHAARIKALHSFDILDTEREDSFDEIVNLVADLCDVPISVVNFIDEQRQWFKAETGLGVRETPLETSICSHVILEHDFVEIHDTLQDPRMADNPLCCSEPGLRFYAGALLKTEDGLPLGTLCVLDYEPRTLTELQKRTVRVMAEQVMARLTLRRALRDANVFRREVDHRVKNSLQSIESLARLSARATEDDSARMVIDTMAGRIASVSRLHELLYEINAGQRIDLDNYIDRLAGYFQSMAPSGVAITTDLAPLTVSSKTAASLGLLVNEFVANSFKHGFPDGASGTITIETVATQQNRMRMTLRDSGVGLDESESASGQKGLGKVILQTVCTQLGSDADLRDSGQGVELSIEFDLQDAG